MRAIPESRYSRVLSVIADLLSTGCDMKTGLRITTRVRCDALARKNIRSMALLNSTHYMRVILGEHAFL